MLAVQLILQPRKDSKQVSVYFESRYLTCQNVHFCTKLDMQFDNMVGRICASEGWATAKRCCLWHTNLLRVSREVFSSSTARHISLVCALILVQLSAKFIQFNAFKYIRLSPTCALYVQKHIRLVSEGSSLIGRSSDIACVADKSNRNFRGSHLELHRVYWRRSGYTSSLIYHD